MSRKDWLKTVLMAVLWIYTVMQSLASYTKILNENITPAQLDITHTKLHWALIPVTSPSSEKLKGRPSDVSSNVIMVWTDRKNNKLASHAFSRNEFELLVKISKTMSDKEFNSLIEQSKDMNTEEFVEVINRIDRGEIRIASILGTWKGEK